MERSRKADHELRVFVNALRECLGHEPLYERRYIPDAERFYRPPVEIVRVRTRGGAL